MKTRKAFLKILLLSLAISNLTQAEDQFDQSIEISNDLQLEAPAANDKGSWSFLIPAFVVHGVSPGTDVSVDMPRKLDRDGKAVVTPGFGFEYQHENSFDFVMAFVKDCYDHYAATLQAGQFLKVGKNSEIGYTVGLYVRETPIACYTTTTTTSTGSPAGLAARPGGGNSAPKTNTFTTTTCGFQDSLPLRYTVDYQGRYIDIIPSPFLNFTTDIYRGSWTLRFKIMSNFYLNEVGLSVPF